jgi:hypothetical protein
MAQLYASSRVHPHIRSLAHFFKTGNSLDSKLNLASANYELVQSIPEVIKYLGPNPKERWERIADFEEKLQEILLSFLREKEEENRVVVWGERSSHQEVRVPVVSFTVKGMSSKAVVDEVEKRSNFGFRNGHMYSYRLVQDIMRLEDPEDGVVRVSMLHYNTGKFVYFLFLSFPFFSVLPLLFPPDKIINFTPPFLCVLFFCLFFLLSLNLVRGKKDAIKFLQPILTN